MAVKNGRYIPDASTLIKWVGLEMEDLEQAEAFREDYKNGLVKIVVPALMFWELGNYLGRHFDEETATSLFNHFQNYQIQQALVTLETATYTVKIMKRYPKTSFYDASYHALAVQLDGIFLTSDKKYYDKAKSLGHIQLLKDY